MTEQQHNEAQAPRRRFWAKTAAVAVIGSIALSACGHRGGGGWRSGDSDPAQKITHMVDKVFSRVDATDEQKAKITEIAQQAYTELRPVKDQMRSARKEAMQILTAEQIDRAALEKLRADRMTAADKATVTASGALADIAEVLTPAQRLQVREKLAARMEHKRWHRRHW